MPDPQRIDPVLVEKAIEAFEKAPEYSGEGPDTTDRAAMEAAIEAVFDELGLRDHHQIRRTDGEGNLLAPGGEWVEAVRPIGRWRLLAQGDAKC